LKAGVMTSPCVAQFKVSWRK